MNTVPHFKVELISMSKHINMLFYEQTGYEINNFPMKI